MNKRDLSKVLSFIAGAAVGSAVTWYFANRHFNEVLDEEFESMREYFEQKDIARREEEISELKDAVEDFNYSAKEAADKAREKPNIMDYAANIQESKYVDYSGRSAVPEVAKEVVDENDAGVPYVVSPEMIENSEYNLQTLTYYADGVLTDDWNDLENYADDLAGSNFADHFGDYVDDVVHVRNDRLRIDYEITYDPRNYSDTVNPGQHSMEDE